MINTTTFDDKNAVSSAPRALNEDVLQSAEQAVLGKSGSDALPTAGELEAKSAGVLTRYRAALAGQVARKPGQSALIALAAGALAAAALRSVVSRRRR